MPWTSWTRCAAPSATIEVVNNGAQHQARAFFDLTQDVEDEVFDMLETVTKLHETLSTLIGLQPASLNDDGGDES